MKAKAHADESAQLTGMIDHFASQIDDMQSRLADKDSLNRALTDSCIDLKAKVESMVDTAAKATALQNELEQVKKEHEATVQAYEDLEQLLQRQQAAHQDTVLELRQHETDALEHLKEQLELTHDKSMLQAEKNFHEQLQQLKAESQSEIDKYQSKYFTLLQQLQANVKSKKEAVSN